ncbi:MAG: hypothetical protein K2K26_10885 [Muribaculaceae bacterium]|nr:hypothetical protein [Muribaculaceae bacterium]
MPYDHEIKRMFKDIFVSSWISDKNESIGLWKMFSSLESGVRIGINTTNMFSKSESCEVQVTPLAFRIFGNSFKQKKPCNTIEMVAVEGRESCKVEILEILNSEEQESSIEEIHANLQKKKNLPYISSNSLSYPNEVRLISKVLSKNKPTNKKELKEYEAGIGMDDNFEFILVSLPSSFFEDIEIVVSPDFSETNYITLNAFLSKVGLHTAIRSHLTSSYHNYKDKSTLINM